ncbi:helix-turn-helix transcriptional regulator [bacterium]|nr:helix-turn-helix transcriptional regulator [bacterium]
MSIGKRIKELKTLLRVTSKKMAQELDIPVRTLGSYERDETPPGHKFYNALIDVYNVNINWLLTGRGSVFCSDSLSADNEISKLKEKISLSEDELKGLISIMETKASRDLVMKFVDIKRGNREALDALIYSLQGIKAICV